jgi:hypothetical protein
MEPGRALAAGATEDRSPTCRVARGGLGGGRLRAPGGDRFDYDIAAALEEPD